MLEAEGGPRFEGPTVSLSAENGTISNRQALGPIQEDAATADNKTPSFNHVEHVASDVVPERPVTFSDLSEIKQIVKGSKADKRLQELRAGIIKPTSVADFFLLTHFGQDRYAATNDVMGAVVNRRKNKRDADIAEHTSLLTSPYQEHPEEAIEAAAVSMADSLKPVPFVDDVEEKLFNRANNQITALKGQLTLAINGTHRLNHVQANGFRTRQNMEDMVFGKNFVRSETDPEVKRTKSRLKRELAAYKRMAATLQEARRQYALSLNPPVEPVQEPATEVASSMVVETVSPEAPTVPISSIVTVLPKPKVSLHEQTRREFIQGSWKVAAPLLIADVAMKAVVVAFKKHNEIGAWTKQKAQESAVALVKAVGGSGDWIKRAGERAAFDSSTMVLDLLGKALPERFPAPATFPERGKEIAIEVPTYEPMPQTVAELVKREDVVVSGLRALFKAGRFKPKEDVYWNIDSAPQFNTWAQQIVTELSTKVDSSQRIDSLNANHRAQGAVFRPRDVVEEVLTRLVGGDRGENELCKLCGLKEQQERLADVQARVWYQTIFQESRPAATEASLNSIMDRLSGFEWQSSALQDGQNPADVVENYLKGVLPAQWRDNSHISQMAIELAQGRLGMIRVNESLPEEVNLNALDVGAVISFDPHLAKFVEGCLQRAENGQININTFFNRVDLRTLSAGQRLDTAEFTQASPAPSPWLDGHTSKTISYNSAPGGQMSEMPLSHPLSQSIEPVEQAVPSGDIGGVLQRLLARPVSRRWVIGQAVLAPVTAEAMLHAGDKNKSEKDLLSGIREAIDGWSAEFKSELARRSELLFRENPMPFSTVITTSDGTVIRNFHPTRDEKDDRKYSLPFDEDEEVPLFIAEALIATENKNFFEDPGVDLVATGIALGRTLTTDMTTGGSTLTQQLVRTLAYTPDELRGQFSTHDGRMQRKQVELLLAPLYESTLEKRLGSKLEAKKYILRQFLNTMFFGRNAVGIKAASQAFFGKPINSLSLAEAASLVGLLQQPGQYSLDAQTAANRAQTVIRLMTERAEELGKDGQRYAIDPRELAEAKKKLESAKPLKWITEGADGFNRADGTTWHLGEQILEELGGAHDRGVVVRTTIDSKIQKQTWQIAHDLIEKRKKEKQYKSTMNASVIVVNPKTGEVIAQIANTRGFFDEQDGTVNERQIPLHTEPRSPGSTLKPFLIATAMRYFGYTAKTGLFDTDYSYKGITPQNYNNEVWPNGRPSVKEALANSLNRPMLHLIGELVGVERMADICESLGIVSIAKELRREPDILDEGIAIGSTSVKLIELAEAYTAVYNGGKRVKLRTIDTISHRGKVTSQPTSSVQAMSPEVANELFGILGDPKARDWGYNRKWLMDELGIDDEVAFKTGTSSSAKGPLDSRIMAFDKRTGLMVAVWVGNTDRTPLPVDANGANTAGKLAGDVIKMLRIVTSPGGYDVPPRV